MTSDCVITCNFNTAVSDIISGGQKTIDVDVFADSWLSSKNNNERKSRRKNPPRRKIKSHCYECGTGFENEQLLKVHSATCSVVIDEESDLGIKKNFESENDFKSPKRQTIVNINQEKKLSCDKCPKKFKTQSRLSLHQRIHGLNVYTCGLCTETFSTKAKCKEHVQTHGEAKPYSCDVCGKKYVLRESLNRHHKIHDASQAYVCNDCGKAFSEKISFHRHRTIHTGEKPYVCSVCGLAFRDPSTMRKHRTRHNEEKPYECETCQKKFASQYDKRKHVKIHIKNEDREYICEYCNKGFYLSAAYRTHLRIHTGEKPHHCHICHKGFGDQRNLWAHMQVHLGVKSLQCDHCGQQFRWHCNLYRHIQVVHLRAKQHKCDICGKEFGQKAALNNHVHTHSQDKPYVCKKCDFKFGERSSLIRHEIVHSKAKPYSCYLCKKAFGRKFALTRHIKIHNIDETEDHKMEENVVLVEKSSEDYILNIMNEEVEDLNDISCVKEVEDDVCRPTSNKHQDCGAVKHLVHSHLIIPASNICNLDQTSYRNENWQTIEDGHNDTRSIEEKRIETSPKVISHVNTDGQGSGKTYQHQHFCNHTANEVIYNDTPGYTNKTSEVSMKQNKRPMSEKILTTPLQIMDPHSSTFENSDMDGKNTHKNEDSNGSSGILPHGPDQSISIMGRKIDEENLIHIDRNFASEKSYQLEQEKSMSSPVNHQFSTHFQKSLSHHNHGDSLEQYDQLLRQNIGSSFDNFYNIQQFDQTSYRKLLERSPEEILTRTSTTIDQLDSNITYQTLLSNMCNSSSKQHLDPGILLKNINSPDPQDLTISSVKYRQNSN